MVKGAVAAGPLDSSPEDEAPSSIQESGGRRAWQMLTSAKCEAVCRHVWSWTVTLLRCDGAAGAVRLQRCRLPWFRLALCRRATMALECVPSAISLDPTRSPSDGMWWSGSKIRSRGR